MGLKILLLLACCTLASCTTRTAVVLDELEPMVPATLASPDPLLDEGRAELPPEAAPVSDADLWARLRSGFALPLDTDNPRVRAQRNWYANNQSYLDRVASRAERYLHHIVTEAEKRGLPLELALLPIVESAFDPFAYSHARAAGPWQFIESTGRAFGLQRDFWQDNRRDIIASTDAALTYLERLADRFEGDWLLALASYNGGAGNISRAIRRNQRLGRATDFWSLQLPRETMAYVPKLIGLAQLVKDPDAYGIRLQPIADEPYFSVVDIGSALDLAQAAELAEVSIEELYMLNPHLNQWATPQTGPHRLLVPAIHAEGFSERLASLDNTSRMRWQHYKIQRGDTLSGIASRFNTTMPLLRAANKLKSQTIVAGQDLLIPVPARSPESYSLSADARLQAKQNRPVSGRRQISYRVAPGDAFWTIARQHGVSVAQLTGWNNMAPADTLRIGQTLVIWIDAQQAQIDPPASIGHPDMMRRITYPVRQGDSLSRIASRFNISVSSIQQWNRLDPDRYLQPGQQLTLYVDVRNAR